MKNMTTTPMPRWASAVSVLLLLWALIGVWSFYNEVTISPEAAAAMPPEQRAMWETMPGWLWVVFAVAVFSALAGAFALLMKRAFAESLYLASLVAVAIQFAYVFLAMPVLQTIGPAAIPFPAVIIIVAGVSYWLARNWKAKGWLG
jgi:hypothetical protein